jgi:hypothetical protein
VETIWTITQIVLMVAGIPLAIRGLRREWRAIWLPIGTPGKVLQFFRGFRMSVIGLALIGIGAGWMLGQTWLILLSLAIGIEETIESSIDVFALTKGRDLRLGPAIPQRPATGR